MAPELDTDVTSARSVGGSSFGALARAVLGVFLAVFLVFIWWLGQGCVDDPCSISRAAEWTGAVAVVVFGALFLRVASSRYWPARAGLWVITLAPALRFYRGLEPVTEGPITTDGPDIAAATLVLLGAYLVMAIITLLIEIVAAVRSS